MSNPEKVNEIIAVLLLLQRNIEHSKDRNNNLYNVPIAFHLTRSLIFLFFRDAKAKEAKSVFVENSYVDSNELNHAFIKFKINYVSYLHNTSVKNLPENLKPFYAEFLSSYADHSQKQQLLWELRKIFKYLSTEGNLTTINMDMRSIGNGPLEVVFEPIAFNFNSDGILNYFITNLSRIKEAEVALSEFAYMYNRNDDQLYQDLMSAVRKKEQREKGFFGRLFS